MSWSSVSWDALGARKRSNGELLLAWQDFYDKVFDIKFDSTNLELPTRNRDFSHLIVIHPDITLPLVMDRSRRYLKYLEASHELVAREVTSDDRSAQDESYAVWIRGDVDPEEDFRGLTAEDLRVQNVSSITLLERLLFGLWVYKYTRDHLDYGAVTLCAGSRYSDGSVPFVGKSGDHVNVGTCEPSYKRGYLRTREVIKL